MKALQNEQRHQQWHMLSVSISGTLQQEPKEEDAKLFERTDAALYASKNNGKARYTQC